MDVDAGYRTVRIRRRRSVGVRAALWTVAALLVVGGVVAAVGFAFAGSSTTLPEGTEIAGVDVGGLSTGDARRLLEERSDAVRNVPVVFTGGDRRWHLTANRLQVQVDWKAAV